jgi:hypothetical protein
VLVACQTSLPSPPRRNLGPAPGLGQPPRPARALDPRFGVVEGFANPSGMAQLGAGWERAVFFWPQIQPSGPTDFSGLGRTLPRATLEADVQRGVRLAGVLEFTPAWAALKPADGAMAVPRNLDLPVDDPDNVFARFVFETVRYYAGWIDEWVIWNEPDFRPDDPGSGDSTTWLGTDAQFARLLTVAYLAAKEANPRATISFPATSYWVEELSSPKRPLFYDRLLKIIVQDPQAAEHDFYHDAVSVNLYRNPDDVYRVHGVFKDIQLRYGVDKPVWLTETNAMPSDDRRMACWQQHTKDPYQTTLDQQAAFGVQAFALAAAAGYQRVSFYKMVDDNACQQSSAWGLWRDDGTPRPVANALGTAIRYLSGFTGARFVPLARTVEHWPAWPAHVSAYTPNWRVYQVVLDRPGNERVLVLWNGDATPVRVQVPRTGSLSMVDLDSGSERPVTTGPGSIASLELPGATATFHVDDKVRDPDGYHYIGGAPVLIIEREADPASAVQPPALVERV